MIMGAKVRKDYGLQTTDNGFFEVGSELWENNYLNENFVFIYINWSSIFKFSRVSNNLIPFII